MSSLFLTQLEALRADPTRLQSLMYDQIEAAKNGDLKIVDPTNPVALCLEATAFTAAGLDGRDRIAQRASYRNLAESWEDLYRHMSDEDFIGRFATPAMMSMRLLFSLGDLMRVAVPVPDTGIKKVIIPKNTTFTVGGHTWTLQYPIEIRFMAHGGIRVVYDTSVPTPLLILESNLVQWSTYWAGDEKLIELEFMVHQFKQDRYLDTLSAGNGFRKSYPITDSFYYCRVYGRTSSGALTELRTTHSNEVYDARVPTAILEVEGSRLTVSIPLIYFTKGMLPGGIQVDILTTKGDIVFQASDYEANQFELNWGTDYNSVSDTPYSTILSDVSQMSVYSLGQATGGSNGLTFEELRERSIFNANKTSLPITDKQLEAALQINGYEIIRSIDNVVRRVYLASRSLSASSSGFNVGAGCSISTTELALSQVIGQQLVRDNGSRITLMAGMLFDQKSGAPQLVTDSEAAALRALPKDRLINQVLASQYVFTPLSYVLDTTNNGFAVRAYDFENPDVGSRQFILENDTAAVSISTVSHLIEQTAEGYTLTVLTSSDDGYKDLATDKLFCQLYFKPENELERCYLNGELVGLIDGEYVWRFRISTKFDVTDRQLLAIENFAMYVAEPRKFYASLDQEFGIIYGLVDVGPDGFVRSDIDLILGRNLLDPSAIGIAHEQFKISFGYYLKDFWSNGRTVASNLEFLRYTQDVPLTYSETIYLRDGAGDIILTPGESDEPQYTVVHRKGDPVIMDGEIQYRARRGDLVLDEETNLPIAINSRKTMRQIDLFLVDGVYFFATGERDIEYRKSIPKELTTYLKQDLASLTPRLLEKTNMYLYPKRTIGSVAIFVQDGQLISIPAGLGFTVRYWLDEVSYTNELLRENIRLQTHQSINRLLQARQFGTDDLIVDLTQRMRNDFIAVDVDKIGPNRDIPNYTMFDDTARCSVRRKLKALPDDTVRVVEDITVEFILHRTA